MTRHRGQSVATRPRLRLSALARWETLLVVVLVVLMAVGTSCRSSS